MLDWKRLRRQPQVLIVMRSAEMVRVHPETDFSRKCSRCAAEVGIYPSGQRLIRKLGERRVVIVCNRCIDTNEARTAEPAPGALAEVKQSVKREIN